jgi:delta14-sterol reductase
VLRPYGPEERAELKQEYLRNIKKGNGHSCHSQSDTCACSPPIMSNSRTTSYEFLGPPGALAISLGVPIITYALYFGCSEATGGCPPQLTSIDERIVASVSSLDWWKNLWDTDATLIYLGWYTFCVVAWAILPGDQVEGTTLRNGGQIQYKINGTTLIMIRLKLYNNYNV